MRTAVIRAALIDAGLSGVAGLAVILVHRAFTGSYSLLVTAIAAIAAIGALAFNVLQLAVAEQWVPVTGSLRRFVTVDGPEARRLKFWGGFARLCGFALMIAAAIELLWNLYLLGQTGRDPQWRPVWVGWELSIAILVLVAAKAWGFWDPLSWVRAKQAVDWKGLAAWTSQQKWVTMAAFSFVVILYASYFVEKNNAELVRELRDAVHIQFLGDVFDLPRLLKIEATGFLLGLLSTFLFSLKAPVAFRLKGTSTQDALRRTLNQCGQEIDGPHFAGTFDTFRELLGQKAEWAGFAWAAVDGRIAQMRAQRVPARKMRDAAQIVTLLPSDDLVLSELVESLFLRARPAWRFLIFALLLTAEVMTIFPLILRVLTFYFPRLMEDPSTWQLPAFLALLSLP